jgi:hypothetical protein
LRAAGGEERKSGRRDYGSKLLEPLTPFFRLGFGSDFGAMIERSGGGHALDSIRHSSNLC